MTAYDVIVRDENGNEIPVDSGNVSDGESQQHTVVVENPSLTASAGNS